MGSLVKSEAHKEWVLNLVSCSAQDSEWKLDKLALN